MSTQLLVVVMLCTLGNLISIGKQMKNKTKNIGIKVAIPGKTCDDLHCPFHGSLSVRGMSFVGTVLTSKMAKTVNVHWERSRLIPKYERYEKKRTRIKAHNPPCIDAQKGDVVRIMQCRPLSKTKNFVVVENLGQEKGFQERMEALEASKFKKVKKEEAAGEEKEVEGSEKEKNEPPKAEGVQQ